MRVAVFSAQPYDQEFIDKAVAANNLQDFEVKYFKDSLDQCVSHMHNFDVVVPFVNDKVDASVIETLSQKGTKLISLRCAGFENVDLQAAKKFGIKVTRVPAYSPYAVAEFAVGLIMTLNRKIHKAYVRTKEQNFSLVGLLGFDMRGKTVGIVGTGKIGAVLAEIMNGFGCKLLGYDVYQNKELVSKFGLKYVELEELLAQSDIISLHAPLTKETKHMINDKTLALMKKGVILINTGRGGLVDSKALIAALKTGKIGALGLDVYERENDIFFQDMSATILTDDVISRLLSFPNVLVTSHQAFFTKDAYENIAQTTITNILDFQQGKDTNEMTKTLDSK